jgi:transposase
MLQISAGAQIYLAVEPVDFRKRIEGLSAICRNHLEKDPLSGALFVFRNRNRQIIRVLFFDGQGQWLCEKRFSKGKLNWWPRTDQKEFCLSVGQLQVLL